MPIENGIERLLTMCAIDPVYSKVDQSRWVVRLYGLSGLSIVDKVYRGEHRLNETEPLRVDRIPNYWPRHAA